MVSQWGTDSHFNNEKIQIVDIDIMTSAHGSSGSFGSGVRPKYIGHNTYIGRRNNFCSKPWQIHGPVYKSHFNYSYSRSHSSMLPQAVSKKIIHGLS